MSTPHWLRGMLDDHGVAYRESHHLAASTATELAEREHFSGHRVAKVVVVVADNRPVKLVLPASRNVNLSKVAQLLGARDVRLATEAELSEFFADCELGAMPPVAHGRVKEVWLDDTLYVDGDILFAAGTHEDAVVLNFQDWLHLVQPRRGGFSTTEELQTLGKRRAHATGGSCTEGVAALQSLVGELLDVLHRQAKEIERLTVHVEQQTDPMLQPSEMPLIVSELSVLQSKLRSEAVR